MEYQTFMNAAKDYIGYNTPNAISTTWIVGGMEGGNCWGGETHPIIGDPEPELTDLDNFLMVIVPNISFLHHKKIMSLIDYNDYTNNDYYGNYTDYRSKEIDLDKLYNYLTENDII